MWGEQLVQWSASGIWKTGQAFEVDSPTLQAKYSLCRTFFFVFVLFCAWARVGQHWPAVCSWPGPGGEDSTIPPAMMGSEFMCRFFHRCVKGV